MNFKLFVLFVNVDVATRESADIYSPIGMLLGDNFMLKLFEVLHLKSTLVAVVGFISLFGLSTAMAGTIAACAADNPVAPGDISFVIDCTGSTSGTLLASMSAPFTYTTSAGTNTGFINSAVYEDDGTLDFYYQLDNNVGSVTPFTTLSANTFANFTTNDTFIDNGSSLGIIFVDGSNMPSLAGNSPDGITTDFYFGNPNPGNDIAPGSQSVVLIISTNATMYTAGDAAVIDGGSAFVPAFQPTSGVPEPATIGLLSLGLLGLTGLKRRFCR